MSLGSDRSKRKNNEGEERRVIWQTLKSGWLFDVGCSGIPPSKAAHALPRQRERMCLFGSNPSNNRAHVPPPQGTCGPLGSHPLLRLFIQARHWVCSGVARHVNDPFGLTSRFLPIDDPAASERKQPDGNLGASAALNPKRCRPGRTPARQRGVGDIMCTNTFS